MSSIPKLLILCGAALIVIGLLWSVFGKWLPFGRLPGDIAVEKENVRFYFPVVSCLVLSALLSLILYIVRMFKG